MPFVSIIVLFYIYVGHGGYGSLQPPCRRHLTPQRRDAYRVKVYQSSVVVNIVNKYRKDDYF